MSKAAKAGSKVSAAAPAKDESGYDLRNTASLHPAGELFYFIESISTKPRS